MDKNVGAMDKRVRTAIGAVMGTVSLATLVGAAPLPAIASPILGVVALVMLGTAATGTCGLYSLLGVDTCSVSPDETR
ncbi:MULTISPECIES: YgaP family membrane protein [Haloferacaceae]|uniref:DUF2892 domain-containing protein n=1 Tax=Halorubrum glutamatedens TaxID=2707018 RepID=A0ABD5QPG4_9EURY|nr:DUF2892 domain-containing protein [Halobellus captivus]